jgi:WD40 repeat protein
MTRSVRRRKGVGLAVSVLCAFAWIVPTAAAELGPIQLVSKTPREQAGFARQAAVSADGNYVAFYGELGGHTGLFRKDLATGALTLVVEGEAGGEAGYFPSISADGRFVSFTTTQQLEPFADNETGSNDVYVADLATSPPAYELASSTVTAGETHRLSGSSTAAPRVAISADGSEVAFVNGGQVYVRRLAEPEPVLITTGRDPATGAMTSEPVPGGGALQRAGAALSADGNAVAWVGEHLPEQVPLLPEEEQKIRAIEEKPGTELNLANRYLEPLWRLVPSAGQGPATRRIVGGGDPLAPGCGGSSLEAACQGPFPRLAENRHEVPNFTEAEGFGWGIGLPVLSADGGTVAVIGSPEDDRDLFVVDMAPGLSRDAAVRRLTKWVDPAPSLPSPEPLFEKAEYLRFIGPIKQCAISADGKHVAFTTQRQSFTLNPPSLLTATPTALPTVAELYQVDLEGQTIERITPGPGTDVSQSPGLESASLQNLAAGPYGEASFGASGPSYSADGRMLAFTSMAPNIVAGDGNDASDVFTVESTPPSPVDQTKISPRPSSISVRPIWRLTAHAVSRPDGAVRIVAGVPGAGTLQAQAKSKVDYKAKARQVSAGQRRAAASGTVRLELNLSPKLRKLARRKGGLYTSIAIQFTGSGGKPLEQVLVARFRTHHPTHAKKGKRG